MVILIFSKSLASFAIKEIFGFILFNMIHYIWFYFILWLSYNWQDKLENLDGKLFK